MATGAGLRLWRCLCDSCSFSCLVRVYASRDRGTEREKKRETLRTTYVQNRVSGMMGLRAIIGFASPYRPRIMPPRALAYSPEDLFRHAHNRWVCFSKGCRDDTSASAGKAGCRWDFLIDIRLLNMSGSLRLRFTICVYESFSRENTTKYIYISIEEPKRSECIFIYS